MHQGAAADIRKTQTFQQRQMHLSVFTMQMSYLKFVPEQSGTEKSPAAMCDDRDKMKTSFSQSDPGTLL